MLSRIETYKILRRIALFAILSLSHAVAEARVHAVNPVTTRAQFTAAVTWANSGTGLDTIFVSANTEAGQGGRYVFGSATWDGSAFTLRAGVAIIGVGSQPVVLHFGGPGARLFDLQGSTNSQLITRFQNVTITSSMRQGGVDGGGAIRATNSTVRLEIDNSIISASTGGNGGAILANNAQITIRHSEIHNSNAQSGGAFHFTNSTVYVLDSRIHSNGCPDPPPDTQHGGAFWISGGRLTVERTNIFNNAVCGEGLGGAMLITGGATVIVQRSNITNNTAVGGGAGFYMTGSGNNLQISYSTIAGNAGTGGWASGGATVVGGSGNNISVDNSVISGNHNPNDWANDGNEISGGANQNISNSVVDTAFVVNNDPTAPCLPPATVTAAGCVVIPDTIIIVVNPDGSADVPPIDLPGGGSVEVGSGGGQTKSLTLIITQDSICPSDTIFIEVQQANIQDLQLWQVDSIGNQIRQIDATFNTMRETFETMPEPNIPIKFFRVFGTYNNAITYSSIESVFVFPFIISQRINHVGNAVIPPLPPTQP